MIIVALSLAFELVGDLNALQRAVGAVLVLGHADLARALLCGAVDGEENIEQ